MLLSLDGLSTVEVLALDGGCADEAISLDEPCVGEIVDWITEAEVEVGVPTTELDCVEPPDDWVPLTEDVDTVCDID